MSASVASATTVKVSLDDGEVSVVLVGLRPRNELRERERSVRVLALVHDPRRSVCVDPSSVASVYGLTSTEALLASAIAEGRTLAEFACARGCSEQTVRTHLKRVLDKTGTNRQSDLVRVLVSGLALQKFR